MLIFAVLALAGVVPTRASVPAPPLPTPQFRHYEVSDGLPSSNVTQIQQDARGLIWMATGNGLVRFDGMHFKVYRHDPRDPDSLHGNVLSALVIDRRQRIWVGGDGTGLNRFDPATGQFRTWLHHKDDPGSLGSNDIGGISVAPDGSIWVSVMGYGLDHMLGSGKFEHFHHRKGDPDSLASNVVLAVKALPDGSVLAGSVAGLDRISAQGQVEHVRFDDLAAPPRVWGIDGAPGRLRISTGKGLYRLGPDGVARRLYPDILPSSLTTTSLRAPDGSLWVGGRFGLYWIGAHGRFRHFGLRMQGPRGVPGSIIWNLALDQEGGMWVGTRDGGVAYLCPVWKRFVVYEHQLGNPATLSINRVITVMADGDSLLVGGPNGALDRIHPATGKVENLRLDIGSQAVTALAPAGNGGLWIAHSRGLMLQAGGKLHKVDPQAFPGGVNRIVSDARGDAFVTRPSGRVYRVDRSTLAVHEVEVENGGEPEHDINAIAMHQGSLWVASMGGMLRADLGGGKLDRVPGTPDARTLDFAFDDDGIWVVRDDGMEHYRLRDGRAVRDRVVGIAQGWPEAQVVAMFVDAEQRVWLATDVGLWRYDPADGSFHSFGKEDGLASQEFTSEDIARLPDGTWYTGTMRGVAGWNPSRVHVKPRPPRLIWTSITVERDGVTQALPRDGRPLELHWDDRELRVSVQALSYLDPKRNHYRFRMDGLDTGWVDTGNHGQRDFSGLAHGDYVLHVQAAGPSGAWARLQPVKIHMARPPWTTWWAWMAYVVIVLALIAATSQLARRRIEQRHRMQMAERERALAEQASAAKSSFLATLGHEIRTPMTGVLGMAELLLRSPLEPRQRGYAEAIQRSGTLLLRLVNEALDMARIEAGRLELELNVFDPRELVGDVLQLESGVAAEKGLELGQRIGDKLPQRVRGDALRIKQILLNLANNALKFTERGHVELAADWVDEGLDFLVSDTGPGIAAQSRERLFQRYEQADGPKRSSGSGLGLAISRELAELMGGRCELASSGPSGSVFHVWLPLPVVEAPESGDASGAESAASWDLLLVEDDATVAGVIRGLLETRGHRVRHAAQGLDGLAEMQNHAFDAVLLDLDLPGMDGFAIARMLRERGERLPIVAITARSGGDEETRSREAGMDAFLRKPLDGERLERTLRELLARERP